MELSRRTFFTEFTAGGALAALLAKPETAHALAAALGQAAPQSSLGNSAAFWSDFLAPQSHGRGLFHKQPGVDQDRQVNFLHFGDQGLRYADQIAASELPDYPGDVAVSMNVGGIRLSTQDRATFEQLQSAQLRIDLLQGQQMYNMIDPLAWMALAAIFPNQGGKLPPLQNLSFDPGSTMQNMQKIVLPGGFGHLAVNVSMLHRESTFFNVIKTLVTDASNLAPVLGLPAISVTALAAFSKLYGILENRTTFLFQARPQPAYATLAARRKADSTIGLNMPSGDYVLVPQSHTDDLKPYLDSLKLANGYLIPKDANATSSVYESAENAKPDISYITMHLSVSSLLQYGAAADTPGGQPGGSGGQPGGSSSSGRKPSPKGTTH